MKSFDEWFSEQGSSQEEPKTAEQGVVPGEMYFIDTFVPKEKPLEKGLPPGNYKAEIDSYTKEKEVFSDYDEVWSKDGRFTRIGDKVYCSLRWYAEPLEYSLQYYMEVLHKQYPDTYPRFEP